MNIRNALFEKGVLKVYSLGVPAVSVGNITVGGTGKTPLVALIAEILSANGEKVGILSRGYGRENPRKRILVSDGADVLTDARRAGDEPFELARKLGGKAVVVADANRVAAGVWAREKFGVTAFVLDDAFQHQRVRRDVDIVCIDATNPFGSGKCLPFGILRESPENLRRADAVVITRANLVESIADLKTQIETYNPVCPIFTAENKIVGLTALKEFSAKPQNFSSKTGNRQPATNNCFAFCALGNPENFFEQLRREKFALEKFALKDVRKFPDHHFYTANDVLEIEKKAEKSGAEILITTAKDAGKLIDLQFQMPCYVAEIALEISGAEDFGAWLGRQIEKVSAA